MVKVPFQNNKNWASYKCLIKKKYMKKRVYHKTFLKFEMWNSRNGTGSAAMYLSFTYMLVYMKLTHFLVVRSQKVLGCTCQMQTKIEN